MSFERAVEFVLRWEGGLVKDPMDRGGLTRWGISQAYHPGLDIDNLTREQAIEIYRTDYWNRIRGDDLPEELAFVTFDAAVNSGPRNAARFLQRALGIKDDGVLGPKTMDRAWACDPRATAIHAIQARARYYTSVFTRHPSQLRFLNGWLARIIDLAAQVHACTTCGARGTLQGRGPGDDDRFGG